MYSAGHLNDAELGLANLKNAVHDPSLMSEVAGELRSLEGRAELIKLMASPKFQDQAKSVAEQMKATGDLADFLKLEYAFKPSGAAVGNSLYGTCTHVPTRHSDVSMFKKADLAQLAADQNF